MNSGTDLLWQVDHGWEDGWANPAFDNNDPAFETQSVAQLTGYVPLVLAISCDTAKFDDPTQGELTNPDGDPLVGSHPEPGLGETWLEADKAGAYIGSSREEPIWNGGFLMQGLGEGLFVQREHASFPVLAPDYRPPYLPVVVGQLLDGAKEYMANTSTNHLGTDVMAQGTELEFNLLGDPSMTWES